MRRARTRTTQTPPGHVVRYGARILDDLRHDPYQPRGKLAGPLQCSECKAVYRNGRWSAASTESAATSALCPACRRIRDKLPAGWLTLEGPAVATHRDELIRIARNVADRERAEHPLHRIIDVADTSDRVEVSTTDIHLPQRIGEALRRAHGGRLRIAYGRGDYSVRVRWQG